MQIACVVVGPKALRQVPTVQPPGSRGVRVNVGRHIAEREGQAATVEPRPNMAYKPGRRHREKRAVGTCDNSGLGLLVHGKLAASPRHAHVRPTDSDAPLLVQVSPRKEGPRRDGIMSWALNVIQNRFCDCRH